jgi:hypothetical protein
MSLNLETRKIVHSEVAGFRDVSGFHQWVSGNPKSLSGKMSASYEKETTQMETITTQEQTKRTNHIRAKYERVNGAWPVGDLPKPSGQEAVAGAKRLYRHFMGRAWKGKWALTSGNRFSYPRGSTYYVNPDFRGEGWKQIVHFLSHAVHSRLYPQHSGHAPAHAQIERAMIDYVIENGWLAGALRREEKTAPDQRSVKLARAHTNLARWQTKAKRAATAIKKLTRQIRRLERALSADTE